MTGAITRKDYVEVSICIRDKDDLGEMGKLDLDQDFLARQKAIYEQEGIAVFSPGDKVPYLSGMGTVQSDCSITPDGPTGYGDPHFKTWSGKHFDFQ